MPQEGRDEPAGGLQGGWYSSLRLTWVFEDTELRIMPTRLPQFLSMGGSLLLRESFTHQRGRVSQPISPLLCPASCTVGSLPCCLLAFPSPGFWILGCKWVPGAPATTQCHNCLLGSFPLWCLLSGFRVPWESGTPSAIFMVNGLPLRGQFLRSCGVISQGR